MSFSSAPTRRLAAISRHLLAPVPCAMTTSVSGKEGTPEYRLRFKDGSGEISPWHDIQLHTNENGVYNVVIEIPKMTKPKMEVATKEPSNPIALHVKKGKLRDYHGPIYWNYGMFPQTWENPGEEHPDPLDVVEIGSAALAQGSVVSVKVLGALTMIDDGELDWKVIAISTNDPLAAELNDIQDVEAKCPGVVSGIREWFRWFKTPDGKPLNAYGFSGAALPKAKAVEVVQETHEAWQKLRSGKVDKKERLIGWFRVDRLCLWPPFQP